MKVTLAQIHTTSCDLESNFAQIKSAYEKACEAGARICLTPELSLVGYPLLDLALRPELLSRQKHFLEKLTALTSSKSCALIIGALTPSSARTGNKVHNSALVLDKGKVAFTQSKTYLPAYDVFDESRVFEAATEIKLWECDGKKIALAICEDLWGDFTFGGQNSSQKRYSRDLTETYDELGADFILSLSASPFERKKGLEREALASQISKRSSIPLVYLNQISATDELLFDGSSFVVTAQGTIAERLKIFEADLRTIDLENLKETTSLPLSELAAVNEGLVFGIRDYFAKTGFKKALLGLSGGIDSAVVAVLAVQALGRENVHGIAMPSLISSSHSLEDAEKLAQNLGIPFEVKPIKFSYATLSRELGDGRGGLSEIATENLQARLRGLTLMTLSNHMNALVLTTGNKSEIALGYCTLYGDMAGALAPIGDLYKTEVYELAKHLNRTLGEVIPTRTITKAPSAELKPNQTDQDTLPSYPILDEILKKSLEEQVSREDLAVEFDSKLPQNRPISWILKTLEINEYKRRQAAPVLRVTKKSFGIGRRVPIAKRFDR